MRDIQKTKVSMLAITNFHLKTTDNVAKIDQGYK